MTFDHWIQVADFLGKCGQFIFGMCTLFLTILALFVKRRDLFRSELAKRQVEELSRIRNALQTIFFDIYYIPMIESDMRIMGWNLDNLKENDRESWDQYQRYKNTCMDLFYKFTDPDYFLFPNWLDKKKISLFGERMKVFAPFTLASTVSTSAEERKNYMNLILETKAEFDKALKKNA